MKKIVTLIDLNTLNKPKEAQGEVLEDEISKDTAHVVNVLFNELKSIFPAFRQAWPTNEDLGRAKISWVKAFQAVKLCRIGQLRRGIEKCRLSGRPFAPSVGEFIEWCKLSPEDLGLPHLHEAFVIAGRMNVLYGDYIHDNIATHTVLKHVLARIGSQKFREMNERDAIKVFTHYYTVACRQYAEGEIKPLAIAIAEKPEPHPVDKVKTDEARKKAMDAIRGFGVVIKLRDSP